MLRSLSVLVLSLLSCCMTPMDFGDSAPPPPPPMGDPAPLPPPPVVNYGFTIRLPDEGFSSKLSGDEVADAFLSVDVRFGGEFPTGYDPELNSPAAVMISDAVAAAAISAMLGAHPGLTIEIGPHVDHSYMTIGGRVYCTAYFYMDDGGSNWSYAGRDFEIGVFAYN